MPTHLKIGRYSSKEGKQNSLFAPLHVSGMQVCDHQRTDKACHAPILKGFLADRGHLSDSTEASAPRRSASRCPRSPAPGCARPPPQTPSPRLRSPLVSPLPAVFLAASHIGCACSNLLHVPKTDGVVVLVLLHVSQMSLLLQQS